ncbi:MAG TPA: hypothetical protein V6C93_37540 [Allocoleopsis sp.]
MLTVTAAAVLHLPWLSVAAAADSRVASPGVAAHSIPGSCPI